MNERFLGNLGAKTLHALDYCDGRCKISSIKEENKKFFCTFEDGYNFPSPDNRLFSLCGICIPKYKKAQDISK